MTCKNSQCLICLCCSLSVLLGTQGLSLCHGCHIHPHVCVCIETHLPVLTVALWPCVLHSLPFPHPFFSFLFLCYSPVLRGIKVSSKKMEMDWEAGLLFFFDLPFPFTWSSCLPYIFFTHHPLTPRNYCSIILSQSYTDRTLLPWKHMIPIIKSPHLY